MSRLCDLCDRGSNKIYSRSNSHIATIKHQQPNLQIKTIGGVRIKMCTRCIKSMKREAVAK